MFKPISSLLLLASLAVVEAQTCDPPARNCSSIQTCVSGTCFCNDGYEALAGTIPLTCNDIDECARGTDNCDSSNGYCVDYDPPVKFECGCLPGYRCTTDACTTCVTDTSHPCNINNGNCNSPAVCVPLANNGLRCECPTGFTGDGTTCTQTNTGSTPTSSPLASCSTVNQDGSIQCDLDVSTCQTISGTATCVCNDGYTTTSTGTCVDTDECLSVGLNNCTVDRSVCINEPGTFRCQCATGFEDYPGTIRGTHCNTTAEIEATLALGGSFSFTTGVAGITVFGTSEQETFSSFFNQEAEINATYTYSNITSVTTTRRRLVGGRTLQTSVTSIVFTCTGAVVSTMSSTSDQVLDINDSIERALEVIEDIEEDGTEEEDYLDGLCAAYEASSTDVNAEVCVLTDLPAITETLDSLLPVDVSTQLLVDMGISTPLISTLTDAGLSSTPSGSPTMAPSDANRFLEVEEEDFFGDWDAEEK